MSRGRPTSPEDERAALGAALVDPSLWPDTAARVGAKDFTTAAGRICFEAMDRLAAGGVPLNTITLVRELRDGKMLDRVGGAAWVARLPDGVPASLSFADRVARDARRRRFADLAEDLHQASTGGAPESDLAALVGQLQRTAEPTGQQLEALDLSVKPDPPQWLVRNIVAAGGKTLIAAQSNSGKSWLVESLALAVVSGTAWMGEFSVTDNSGPVILVDQDSPTNALHYRLDRLASAQGWRLQDPEWGERLVVFSQSGIRIGERWPPLVAEVRQRGACLVILDAASRFLSGSDCDPEHVNAFWDGVDDLRREGASVLVVHHSGWVADGRPRGRSEWRDTADIEMNLRNVDGRLTLSWPKVRDGSVPEQLEINIEDTPSGGVLVNCKGLAVSELRSARRCVAVQEFVQAQGGEVRTAQIQAEFSEWGSRAVFTAISGAKKDGLVGSEKKGIVHAK